MVQNILLKVDSNNSHLFILEFDATSLKFWCKEKVDPENGLREGNECYEKHSKNVEDTNCWIFLLLLEKKQFLMSLFKK